MYPDEDGLHWSVEYQQLCLYDYQYQYQFAQESGTGCRSQFELYTTYKAICQILKAKTRVCDVRPIFQCKRLQ